MGGYFGSIKLRGGDVGPKGVEGSAGDGSVDEVVEQGATLGSEARVPHSAPD